jgi:hypothetical protein
VVAAVALQAIWFKRLVADFAGREAGAAVQPAIDDNA